MTQPLLINATPAELPADVQVWLDADQPLPDGVALLPRRLQPAGRMRLVQWSSPLLIIIGLIFLSTTIAKTWLDLLVALCLLPTALGGVGLGVLLFGAPQVRSIGASSAKPKSIGTVHSLGQMRCSCDCTLKKCI